MKRHKKNLISFFLFLVIVQSALPVFSDYNITTIATDEGRYNLAVQKAYLIPEEINLKKEIEEFRLFRNRYVIFGIYLFSALYYNWLTRSR